VNDPKHRPPELPRGAKDRLRALFERLRGEKSPVRAGLSLALGVFIGCLPLYGLHLPLCLLLCVPLRLDAVLAYIGANVSNPFFAPVLVGLELQVGSLILNGDPFALDLEVARSKGVLNIAREAIVGSVVVGAALGFVSGSVAYTFARARGRSRGPALDAAVRRTAARYAGARLGDRIYVQLKLRMDPSLREIAALGPLGVVVDAGCGRGQLGLALRELGLVTTLRGFDFDARKVAVAAAAAREDGRFEPADLTNADFGQADTILLVDVLHYLPVEEQDRLLARASERLRAPGRLIVREIERRASPSSWFARGLEAILTRTGYNRTASALAFRSAQSIAERLAALGLECRVRDGGAGTPFDNHLIVASLSPPAATQASSNSLQNSSVSRPSSEAER